METNNSAIHFATNIVELYQKESFKQILTNQRLQRLIFLFYLHYLKAQNKHLFSDTFVCFKLGGVIKHVYSEYKVFFGGIQQPASYLVYNQEEGFTYAPYSPMPLSEEQSQLLVTMVRMYDHLDEWALADKCIELLKSENIELYSLITKRQLVNMSSQMVCY